MLERRPMTDREREKYLGWLRGWLAQAREEEPEEMGEFFSRRVDIYEDRHLGRWGEEYTHIADCFDEGLGRLLDVGCGTGLELASLYRRFPDLQVTGIDLSETMLDQLRAAYPGRDLRLIQADYTAWDLGEGEYDGVLSFETLHHLLPGEKEKLYRRIYRTLRPGGCYVECDYVACCQEEQDLCRDHYEHRRAKYQVPPGQVVHIDIPLTLDRQMELLDRAGFRDVQVLHQRECTVILKAYRLE